MDNNNISIHQVLPQDFKAPKSFSVCSNLLVDVKYIINDRKFIPLLIGEGLIPRIWLYAKSGNNSISIVKDNISNLPNVKVNIYTKQQKITIVSSYKDTNTTILELIYYGDFPNITNLDLRPIGYNIWGDSTEMTIGGSKMVQNTFQGMESFIAT